MFLRSTTSRELGGKGWGNPPGGGNYYTPLELDHNRGGQGGGGPKKILREKKENLGTMERGMSVGAGSEAQ